MSDVKLAIVYYSATGTVRSMAERLAAAGEQAGAEVRLRQVDRQPTGGEKAATDAQQAEAEESRGAEGVTADDVVWADAVLFGSPTRYGNIAGQLKVFIDSLGPQWAQGQLADKVYAGFTSSQTAHGGQETTLLALYNSIYHFGGIIVPPATPTARSSSTATPTASPTSPVRERHPPRRRRVHRPGPPRAPRRGDGPQAQGLTLQGVTRRTAGHPAQGADPAPSWARDDSMSHSPASRTNV